MTNKHPSLFTKSGYSNASSPGTASSGSSTNSQCYGQSPDFSVDSLINTLLQVVNGDNFNGPASCNIQFSQTGNSVNNRCKDCLDAVCDLCSSNRLLVGITSKSALNNWNCIFYNFVNSDLKIVIYLESWFLVLILMYKCLYHIIKLTWNEGFYIINSLLIVATKTKKDI